MRIVVQRIRNGQVTAENEVTGAIQDGLLCLVGVTHEDTEEDAKYLAQKVVHLRIFEDEEGKMNRSLLDQGGALLSVSQFTLYGDCRKGRRPNMMQAAPQAVAEPIWEAFNQAVEAEGVHVEIGRFGAMMDVTFTNVGPVTFIVESKN